MSNFKGYDTQILVITRDALLDGLERVGKHIDAGTFNVVGEKGKVPPSQSGQITLALLVDVNNELVSRGFNTVFK